ncbi:hypothetical protein GCM10027295_18870 [Pseudaeromonas pectinilytica]
MITGGDLRQSRLDIGYKTFTISPCLGPPVEGHTKSKKAIRHLSSCRSYK